MIEIKESSTDSSSPLKLDKSLSNFNCSFSISEQESIKGLLYIKKNCIAFISEEQNKEQTIQINFKEINQINYNEEDIEEKEEEPKKEEKKEEPKKEEKKGSKKSKKK